MTTRDCLMSDTIHFTAASSGHVVDAAHLLDGVSAYGANEAGNLQTEGAGGVKGLEPSHPGAANQHFVAHSSTAWSSSRITMLAIAANTLYLGWAANTNASDSGAKVEFDIAFTAWFGVELFIKMIADRVQFFVGEERAWNWFDMALVGESFVGLFSQGSKLSFLRIFRVFRLVRVVKVVRSVKALARLRTMIFAILSSFVDLLWAFLVIVLIVFVFAIVFDNAVADYFDSITVDFNATDRDGLAKIQEVEDMNTLFGNLPETMISLWSAVSGGNDWMNYGDYLRTAGGWFYFGLFNFYIAFCVVGMFNVVTGVFVDSAVCVRTGDEVVQGYLDDLRQTTEEIKGFFKDADTDGSGTLNWAEFQSHMKNPAVKAYFSGLDIDPEEAEIIFTILDGDKSKEIKIDEFVHGTMKLKGSATKLDLMALMYDQTRQGMKFDALCDFVEDELVEIKRRLILARQKEAERNERAPERPQPGTSASPPRATRIVPTMAMLLVRYGGFTNVDLPQWCGSTQRETCHERRPCHAADEETPSVCVSSTAFVNAFAEARAKPWILAPDFNRDVGGPPESDMWFYGASVWAKGRPRWAYGRRFQDRAEEALALLVHDQQIREIQVTEEDIAWARARTGIELQPTGDGCVVRTA
ncbi:unnamed protein product [Symbiodinium microadriaticum]|nr:unnamed protein product [Symbiodinium microadriaticum]